MRIGVSNNAHRRCFSADENPNAVKTRTNGFPAAAATAVAGSRSRSPSVGLFILCGSRSTRCLPSTSEAGRKSSSTFDYCSASEMRLILQPIHHVVPHTYSYFVESRSARTMTTAWCLHRFAQNAPSNTAAPRQILACLSNQSKAGMYRQYMHARTSCAELLEYQSLFQPHLHTPPVPQPCSFVLAWSYAILPTCILYLFFSFLTFGHLEGGGGLGESRNCNSIFSFGGENLLECSLCVGVLSAQPCSVFVSFLDLCESTEALSESCRI
jgi:hypothetical protein